MFFGPGPFQQYRRIGQSHGHKSRLKGRIIRTVVPVASGPWHVSDPDLIR